MRRKCLLLMLYAFVAVAGYAKSVSSSAALSVAGTAWKSAGTHTRNAAIALQPVYTSYGEFSSEEANTSGSPLYYVFAQGENGFVIVSGDDTFKPLIAISDNGRFEPDNHSPAWKYWMSLVEKAILRAIEEGKPSEAVAEEWNAYLQGKTPTQKEGASSVAALVKTQWAQGSPYNALCPSYSATGCVATAMAQIMKFHQYPVRGTGSSPSYYTTTRRTFVPSVDFTASPYQWDYMLTKHTASTNSAYNEAVARLMYHCGVSIKMDYTPNESGAQTLDVPKAMINYFGYDASQQVYFRDDYFDDEWIELLKTELNAGRPMLYRGESYQGAHAFICDGFDTYNRFHFNFGWGGYDDGFYYIDNIDYYNHNFMLAGIKPNAGGTAQPNLTLCNDPEFSCVRTSSNTLTVNVDIANFGLGTFTGIVGIMLTDFGTNIGNRYSDVWGITTIRPLQYEEDEEWYYYYISIKNATLSTSNLKDGKYQVVVYQERNGTQTPVKPQRYKLANNVITIKNGGIAVDNESVAATPKALRVHSVSGGVEVGGLECGETVSVYDLNGKLALNVKADAETITLPLGKGLYVLKTNRGRSAKFLK
jgi:hypothetical protein